MLETEAVMVAKEIVRQPNIKYPAISIGIGALFWITNNVLDIMIKVKTLRQKDDKRN